MDVVKFGLFLSEERKAKGMTQKELAAKLGVTDKAVSKWERGICLPDVAKFDDIADALGLTDLEVLRAKRLPPPTPKVIVEEVPSLVVWKECGVLLLGCLAAALLCYPGQILELTGVLKIMPLSALCQCAFCVGFGVWYALRRGKHDARFGGRRVCNLLLILAALGTAYLFLMNQPLLLWEFPGHLMNIEPEPWKELLKKYGWSPFLLLYFFLSAGLFDIIPVTGLFACFAVFPAVKLLKIFLNWKKRKKTLAFRPEAW